MRSLEPKAVGRVGHSRVREQRRRGLRPGVSGIAGVLVLAGLTFGASVAPARSAEPTVKPKPPVVPEPCDISGADTIVFTGVDSTGTGPAAWNDPLNWSPNRVPGVGDFACIPSTYGKQVSLNGNDSIPNYAILGVNDESSAGLALTDTDLTLTGTAQPSVLNNFVMSGTSGANLFVTSGSVLDLTGSATIDSSTTSVNGPGTINTVRNATASTGIQTSFEAGLQWNNYGTLTGDGAGLCVSSTNPIVVTNERKGRMVFSTGGGLNDVGGCSGSDQGIVVNDAKASITASNASFSISAPFDNEGTVTDEDNPLTGSSGLSINDAISGTNGPDSGSYTTISSNKTLGQINFNGPRDLRHAVLNGSGTYVFNAINAGVDLGDPTLANVVQSGTTSGGMVITKSLQFVGSENGNDTQGDIGSPTTTEIKSGATLTFTEGARGAAFADGHNLVIDTGGNAVDQEDSICLGAGSGIVNSGTWDFAAGNVGPASVMNCGGGSSTMVNKASGSVLATDPDQNFLH